MNAVSFLDDRSDGPDNAYLHRVRMLMEALRQRGDTVSELHLCDRGPMRPKFRRAFNGKYFRDEFLSADVIHAANALAACSAALAVGGRVPIVYDVHGDIAAEARLEWSTNRTRSAILDSITLPFADRKARAAAAALLIVSKPSMALYRKAGIPADKLFMVRNGVDLQAFSPTPVTDAPERIIGYAGGTQAWQGLPLLVDAFAGWKACRLKLRLIGFSREDAPVKELFARRLGDRAELIDGVPRDEMIRLLRECHALIIPRRPHQAVLVAMPTKFGEYAALARPTIVTDVDETAEFVREYGSGWVAKPSPDGLRRVFDAVADAPTSVLDDMGAAGRKMSEELFAWPVLRAEYVRAVDFATRG